MTAEKLVRVENHPQGALIEDPDGQSILIHEEALARITRELRKRQPSTVDPNSGAWEVSWEAKNRQPSVLRLRVGERWLNIPEFLAVQVISAAVDKLAGDR